MHALPLPAPPRRSSRLLPAPFFRRDWSIAISYRTPFVLELVQSLGSLVMVHFLSKLFSHEPRTSQLRDGYFAFAVVGLSLLSLISMALISIAQRLRTDQTTGTFEFLLATPVQPWAIALASASYDLTYAFVSGVLLLFLAVLVFGLSLHVTAVGAVIALLALLAATAVAAAIGVLYAAFVVVFKSGMQLLGLVGTALALFSGIYYPVSLFPAWLRDLAYIVPLTQAATALRDSLLFREAPWRQTGILAASAVVLLPFALWLFNRAVDVGRRRGTLGQYGGVTRMALRFTVINRICASSQVGSARREGRVL